MLSRERITEIHYNVDDYDSLTEAVEDGIIEADNIAKILPDTCVVFDYSRIEARIQADPREGVTNVQLWHHIDAMVGNMIDSAIKIAFDSNVHVSLETEYGTIAVHTNSTRGDIEHEIHTLEEEQRTSDYREAGII